MRWPKPTVGLVDLWLLRLLLGLGAYFDLVGTTQKVATTRTARRKHMSGVCGLAQKVYVSCVSGFPYRVYIDSNHCDSRI
jgi:hypothetical protein